MNYITIRTRKFRNGYNSWVMFHYEDGSTHEDGAIFGFTKESSIEAAKNWAAQYGVLIK